MTDETATRRGRVGWGTLTRGQIVDAAIAVVRAGGYEQMTIRSLADVLGVAPMSLYRHVKDKDDLLDDVVDRLLARAWRPTTGAEDWRAWTAEAAERLRRFLVAQPVALHVYLTHPVVSPAAIVRMDAMMEVLRSRGVTEEAARRAYAALHTYTVGFAALEASRAAWQPDAEADQTAIQLASYTTPTQFAVGLGYLIQGIEHDRAVSPPLRGEIP